MRLFLDSTSRVFRGVVPAGAITLTDVLTVGTIEVDVADADWYAIYYPAFAASVSSGQDLVIDIFGGTSLVTHTPTAREVAITTLNSYQLLASPTQPQDVVAIKALIVLLEVSKLLATLPVPVVSLQRAPIAQTRRRPTRSRSRSYLISPTVVPLSQPAKLIRGVSRKTPLLHRRGRP